MALDGWQDKSSANVNNVYDTISTLPPAYQDSATSPPQAAAAAAGGIYSDVISHC